MPSTNAHLLLIALWLNNLYLVELIEGDLSNVYITKLERYFLVGQPLSLKCTILNPPKNYTMDWILPSTIPFAVLRGHITGGESLHDDGLRQWKLLTIEKSRLNDTGPYTCSVRDFKNGVNVKTENVTIYTKDPSPNTFLTPRNVIVYSNIGDPYIDLIMDLDNTTKFNFIRWFNHKQQEIVYYGNFSNFPNKYKVKDNQTHTILRIKNVTIYDSGTYRVLANAGNHTEKSWIALVVHDKNKHIVIFSQRRLYYQGELAQALCIGPVGENSEIFWSMKPCLDDFCQFKKMKDALFPIIEGNNFFSNINFTMYYSCQIKCEVKMSSGIITGRRNYYIKDVYDGFNVWGPNDNKLEISRLRTIVALGENITISCAGSIYLFDDIINWYHASKKLLDTNRFVVKKFTQGYSYFMTLTIKNLTYEDSGEYFCVAQSKINRVQKNYSIIVIEPIPPKIIFANLNGTELAVNLQDPIKLFCNSTGLPKPKTRWYKDDIDLEMIFRNSSRLIITDNSQGIFLRYSQIEDEGIYKCVATNFAGQTHSSSPLRFKNKPISNWIYVSLTIELLLLLLFAYYVRRRIMKQKELQKMLHYASIQYFFKGNKTKMKSTTEDNLKPIFVPYDMTLEFSREKLFFYGAELGQGAYGSVKKAEALKIVPGQKQTTVAVKTALDPDNLLEVAALATELKILMHLKNLPNIITILGACTNNLRNGELMMIVEYCSLGSLEDYLSKYRNKFELEINQETIYSRNTLNHWSLQIAAGMEHVSSKKIIHADLAIRNILLTYDLVAKISDFGMAKQTLLKDYYRTQGIKPVPIKWLAVEILKDKIYTTKSDVWSFGVLLWELFSLGEEPYPNMETGEEFYDLLFEGYRMDCPQYSNSDMYDLMLKCWKSDSNDRPEFKELVSMLQNIIDPSTGKNSNTHECRKIYARII